MKRSLITFIAIYLLYERQKRLERRLQELRAEQLATTSDFDRLCDSASEGFRRIGKWQGDLERALKEGAR